jgi:putative ABC transport system substrate-binding protein
MTCRTLGLLVTLALSIFMALVAASAQPRAKPARIAFLGLSPEPPTSARPPAVAAFQQHLRELGWVEGQNLTMEWRWAEGSLERFTTLVEEVVRLPVEVLVVPNQTTAELAQQATTTIPIIIVGGGALAQRVPSLARPGGNVTGFASLGPELAPKRLELLTHAIPGLTRVAVLRGLSPQPLELQALEVGARALGVQLQLLEARNPHRDRPGVCRGGPRGCWRTDGVWGRGLIISTSSQNR